MRGGRGAAEVVPAQAATEGVVGNESFGARECTRTKITPGRRS